MMNKYLFIFFLIIRVSSQLNAAEVPEEMEFGGLRLRLTDGARKLLQADIEMITRGQKAFQSKVERADLYFPIIEKIFKEENLPEDFKFLALQESSLVSDAVSSSNAVGYWQFKKGSAIEVGLRVDHHVDERISIVSSSRGAAKYLKRNNTVLQNWIYALLSYNLGLGGVKSKVEDKYVGANRMTIDKDMHWYVIRFLAHKLAYENAVGKNLNPSMVLVVYEDCRNKSLHQIAKETEVSEENLITYNKWVLKHSIPSDKTYYVVLPVTPNEKDQLLAKNILKEDPFGKASSTTTSPAQPDKTLPNDGDLTVVVKFTKKEKKRMIEASLSGSSTVPLLTMVNKIRAIKAKEGDTPVKLALAAGIPFDDFLRYNDMRSFEKIVPGQTYYLQPKRNKATVLFHTVEKGEDLRTISQKYGVKVNSIRSKNRMDKNESLLPGRVLWLKDKRPKSTPVEIKPGKNTEIVKEEKNIIENKNVVKVSADTLKVLSENTPVKPVTTVIPAKNDKVHEVKAGETLFAINRLYGTSIDSLVSWNQLASYDLKIGQKLIVKKGGIEENLGSLEHRVQQGETLYAISRKYNVSVDEIKKWNNKTDNNVNAGELIIINKKAD